MINKKYYTKILILLLISACMIICTACNFKLGPFVYMDDSEYNYAEEQAKKVGQCFVDNDKKSLKQLLSNSIQNSKKTDDEIDLLFDYLNGDNILYYEFDEGFGSEQSTENDYEYLLINGAVKLYSKNNQYEVLFSYCAKDTSIKDNIGIYVLSLHNEKEDPDYNEGQEIGDRFAIMKSHGEMLDEPIKIEGDDGQTAYIY